MPKRQKTMVQKKIMSGVFKKTTVFLKKTLVLETATFVISKHLVAFEN